MVTLMGDILAFSKTLFLRPFFFSCRYNCPSVSFQGTECINGLVLGIDVPADKDSGKYKINFARYKPGSKTGTKDSEEFDLIIGSDGANSRVAKVTHTKTGEMTNLQTQNKN